MHPLLSLVHHYLPLAEVNLSSKLCRRRWLELPRRWQEESSCIQPFFGVSKVYFCYTIYLHCTIVKIVTTCSYLSFLAGVLIWGWYRDPVFFLDMYDWICMSGWYLTSTFVRYIELSSARASVFSYQWYWKMESYYPDGSVAVFLIMLHQGAMAGFRKELKGCWILQTRPFTKVWDFLSVK